MLELIFLFLVISVVAYAVNEPLGAIVGVIFAYWLWSDYGVLELLFLISAATFMFKVLTGKLKLSSRVYGRFLGFKVVWKEPDDGKSEIVLNGFYGPNEIIKIEIHNGLFDTYVMSNNAWSFIGSHKSLESSKSQALEFLNNK